MVCNEAKEAEREGAERGEKERTGEIPSRVVGPTTGGPRGREGKGCHEARGTSWRFPEEG